MQAQGAVPGPRSPVPLISSFTLSPAPQLFCQWEEEMNPSRFGTDATFHRLRLLCRFCLTLF